MSHRATKPWSIGERKNQLDVLMDGRREAPCHYCDVVVHRRRITLDHIKPICEGGGNESSNLVLSCLPCNQKRGSMSYLGFLRLIGLADQDATLTSEIARLL